MKQIRGKIWSGTSTIRHTFEAAGCPRSIHDDHKRNRVLRPRRNGSSAGTTGSRDRWPDSQASCSHWLESAESLEGTKEKKKRRLATQVACTTVTSRERGQRSPAHPLLPLCALLFVLPLTVLSNTQLDTPQSRLCSCTMLALRLHPSSGTNERTRSKERERTTTTTARQQTDLPPHKGTGVEDRESRVYGRGTIQLSQCCKINQSHNAPTGYHCPGPPAHTGPS